MDGLKMDELKVLDAVLKVVPSRLKEINTEHVARHPAPNKWSPKQELGHLIDSGMNNHQRIVRGVLEDSLHFPGYDGDYWVGRHSYQERDWHELISVWTAVNQQMLQAGRSAPEEGWSHTCYVGDSSPLKVGFILTDYMAHMLHHLEHCGVSVVEFR
jgi:hypothetical protein